MKTPSFSLLALTALCSVLALPATAAPREPGHGPGFGAFSPGLGELTRDRLDGLDTDKDGKISLEEFLAPRLAGIDKLMRRLDKNGDGLISQDELPPARANRPARPNLHNRPQAAAIDRAAVIACVQASNPDFVPQPAPDRETIASLFSTADTNGDGKLSLAEITAAVTARATTEFKRLDKDGDGFLTKADIKAGQAERAALAKALQTCVKAQKSG